MKRNFYTYNIWRKLFSYHNFKFLRPSEKFFNDRNSNIPVLFNEHFFFIYTGNRYKKYIISKWSIGYKFGEFTWNRKLAIYKKKKKK